MKVSLNQEFKRLIAPGRKVEAKDTREMSMIVAAIRAQDYGSKALIPIFGLYFGFMAAINSLIVLGLTFLSEHPAKRAGALGGFIGVFGFCASLLWLIDK